jgi:hypothetical protein
MIAIVVFSLVSCSAPLSSDEVEAREELLFLAPIESDVRLAKPVLEEKGFKCSWVQQQAFGDSNIERDYLYCDSQKLAGVFVARRWQLALVYQSYLVKDIYISIGLVGL